MSFSKWDLFSFSYFHHFCLWCFETIQTCCNVCVKRLLCSLLWSHILTAESIYFHKSARAPGGETFKSVCTWSVQHTWSASHLPSTCFICIWNFTHDTDNSSFWVVVEIPRKWGASWFWVGLWEFFVGLGFVCWFEGFFLHLSWVMYSNVLLTLFQ